MMKNQQEWVKNITPTGMKVKVKRMTDHLARTMRGSAGEKTVFSLLGFASCLLILLGMGMAGCNKETNQTSITNDRLVTIYVDLLDARKAPASGGMDSTLVADSILVKYGMSRQKFLEAIHSRSSHPESWKAFYEEVLKKLEERQQVTDRRADSLRSTIGVRPEPSLK